MFKRSKNNMFKSYLHLITTTLILVVVNVTTILAQDKIAQNIDTLFKERYKLPSPGQAVLVIKDGKVIFKKRTS